MGLSLRTTSASSLCCFLCASLAFVTVSSHSVLLGGSLINVFAQSIICLSTSLGLPKIDTLVGMRTQISCTDSDI